MVREAQTGSILTRRSVRRLSPNTGNVLDFWPRHEAGLVASVTMELEMDRGLLHCLEDITCLSNQSPAHRNVPVCSIASQEYFSRIDGNSNQFQLV